LSSRLSQKDSSSGRNLRPRDESWSAIPNPSKEAISSKTFLITNALFLSAIAAFSIKARYLRHSTFAYARRQFFGKSHGDVILLPPCTGCSPLRMQLLTYCIVARAARKPMLSLALERELLRFTLKTDLLSYGFLSAFLHHYSTVQHIFLPRTSLSLPPGSAASWRGYIFSPSMRCPCPWFPWPSVLMTVANGFPASFRTHDPQGI